MSHRTHYGKVSRALRLGALLKQQVGHGSKYRYFLCLQPICDAVRIQQFRKFLMIELFPSEAPHGKFNLIAYDKDRILELWFSPKVFNARVVEFAATGPNGTVVATEKADGSFTFKGKGSKNDFIWLAQLKAAQAQRAAEQFGSEVSKVGLTESEWLRLVATK